MLVAISITGPSEDSSVEFSSNVVLGADMNLQWKKLTSLVLLLLFLGHSTLKAAACPCCTFHSLVSAATNHPTTTAKPCCNKEAVANSEAKPACCSKAKPASDSCPIEPSDSEQNPSDCSCCVEASPLPVVTHDIGKGLSDHLPTYFELPRESSTANATSVVVTKNLSPPSLHRRLAMISFWRN